MKRAHEEDQDGRGDGAAEEFAKMLKKRRGEGSHVELRVLLASKVRNLNFDASSIQTDFIQFF